MTTAAILHEHPAAPRQLRPELSPRLEQAILTLLEKDRDVRTQTASELRAELTRMRRELGVRASDSSRAPALSERSESKGSSEMVAAASASMTTTAAVATPPPASSSDAQLIAGVMSRHRGAVIGAVALLLFIGRRRCVSRHAARC